MHTRNSKDGQAAPSQKQLSSKAVIAAVLQYSHRKIQENHCLRTRTSHQLTISICVPKMVWPTYCWFASDVTAAMLVVKNKRVSLRWEMNSILMQILQKNFFCIDHQHGRLVTWLQTKNFQKNNLGEVCLSLLSRKRKFVEELKQEYRSPATSQRPEVFENDYLKCEFCNIHYCNINCKICFLATRHVF